MTCVTNWRLTLYKKFVKSGIAPSNARGHECCLQIAPMLYGAAPKSTNCPEKNGQLHLSISCCQKPAFQVSHKLPYCLAPSEQGASGFVWEMALGSRILPTRNNRKDPTNPPKNRPTPVSLQNTKLEGHCTEIGHENMNCCFLPSIQVLPKLWIRWLTPVQSLLRFWCLFTEGHQMSLWRHKALFVLICWGQGSKSHGTYDFDIVAFIRRTMIHSDCQQGAPLSPT